MNEELFVYSLLMYLSILYKLWINCNLIVYRLINCKYFSVVYLYTVLLNCEYTMKCNLFLYFTPVFSVTWNHSNMRIWWSRNIYDYYYQCWTQFCCFRFLWKPSYFLFDSLIYRKFKRTAFIWNSDIIKVFTVTFDQINASSLNKSIIIIIYYFFKALLTNFWMVLYQDNPICIENN